MKKMKHQCPFCGEYVEHLRFCNGFCKCFAKFYTNDNTWLNRHTGEVRKGMTNLSYVEDEE